eukprot:SAG31_NODE_4187_length_3491_cov_2.346698_2_plen_79_part_00
MYSCTSNVRPYLYITHKSGIAGSFTICWFTRRSGRSKLAKLKFTVDLEGAPGRECKISTNTKFSIRSDIVIHKFSSLN